MRFLTLTLFHLAQSTCRVHKTSLMVPDKTVMDCADIVNNPREEVRRSLCKCESGKWVPIRINVPRADPINNDGSIKPAFFGNIIGHAKMLCEIIESIDCWQRSPNRIFPFVEGSNITREDNEEWILLSDPAGDILTAQSKDIIDLVRTICRVIDGGTELLPDILPGLIDEDKKFNNGLSWILPSIIEKLLSGFTGIIDLIDIIGFFDIFTFNNKAPAHEKVILTSPFR